jgi:phage gpG-like protein
MWAILVKVIRKPGPGQKQLRFLLDQLKILDNLQGKVGWFETSHYANKKRTPVAYVAAIHEYGYPKGKIKPRPFMRPTIKREQNKWKLISTDLATKLTKGEINAHELMETLGLIAAGDVRETITQLQTPKLADSTVLARTRRYKNQKVSASSKPLVDTGLLLHSLTNTVDFK